ncbi:methyl-accepting chemotaxis protein [Pseudomonas aeruginosa]
MSLAAKFTQMTVRGRLMTVLMGGLALLALMVLVSLWRLGVINGSIATVNDLNKGINHLTAMRASINGQSISLRDVVLTDREDYFTSSKADLEKNVSLYNQAKAQVLNLPAFSTKVEPETADALKKILELEGSATALIKQVVSLRQEGKLDEARELLIYEAAPAIQMWWAGTSDLIKVKQVAVALQTEDVSSLTSYGFLIFMICLSSVSFILGFFLVRFIANQIMRELGAEPYEVRDFAEAVGGGDLTGSTLKSTSVIPGSIMDALVKMSRQVAEAVKNVRLSADAVAATSAQIAMGNRELSARTEDQASAITETAASMEELGSTVKQNSDNAAQADRLAMEATEVASSGGAKMVAVVDNIRSISESSGKIASIVDTIEAITFQTNILALNAAVEAARAGEQGRGFAVVAQEVRTLAQRSAEAAKEIKELIGHNVQRVNDGTSLVEDAGKTIGDIVASIKRVSQIMSEISHASHEQSAGVIGVGQAIVQMDQATQKNATLVGESAQAVEHLRTQAEHLQEAMQVFKLAIESGHNPFPGPF